MVNLILDVILSFFFIWLFLHGWHAVLGDLEPRRAAACPPEEVQPEGAPEVAEMANSR